MLTCSGTFKMLPEAPAVLFPQQVGCGSGIWEWGVLSWLLLNPTLPNPRPAPEVI